MFGTFDLGTALRDRGAFFVVFLFQGNGFKWALEEGNRATLLP